MREPRRGGTRGAVHLSDTYYAGVGAAAALLAAIAIATSSTGPLNVVNSWPGGTHASPVGVHEIAAPSHEAGSAGVVAAQPTAAVQAAGSGGSGGNSHGHAGHGGSGRGSTPVAPTPVPVAATPVPAADPGSSSTTIAQSKSQGNSLTAHSRGRVQSDAVTHGGRTDGKTTHTSVRPTAVSPTVTADSEGKGKGKSKNH